MKRTGSILLFASGVIAIPGCVAPDDSSGQGTLGSAAEPILDVSTRAVVSGTLNTRETSAAWTDVSGAGIAGCATGGNLVSWASGSSPNTKAGWANNCGGTWTSQLATTSSWGVVTDANGNAATGYGGDGTVIAIPGRPGQFVYTTFMHANNVLNQDVVLAVSNDGGQTFTARLAFNTAAGIGDTDRPVAAADPGAADGTIYLAWVEQSPEVVKLRKVTVHANGTVSFATARTVPSVAGAHIAQFTISVKHDATNDTVFFAYATAGGGHSPGDCATPSTHPVQWFVQWTNDDGVNWFGSTTPRDTDPSSPLCVQHQPDIGYANSTRPEIIYSPALGTWVVVYAKKDPVSGHVRIMAAKPGNGNPVIINQDENAGRAEFRPTFGSNILGDGARFGVSYLTSDSSGNVNAKLNTSADGVTWSAAEILSTVSWTFTGDRLNGDYGGLAATTAGDMWPTWIAENPASILQTVTIEDSP